MQIEHAGFPATFNSYEAAEAALPAGSEWCGTRGTDQGPLNMFEGPAGKFKISYDWSTGELFEVICVDRF